MTLHGDAPSVAERSPATQPIATTIAETLSGAPSITTNAGDLLGDLNAIKAPSCNDAALRVLGLSFAGWNVIASLILAAIAFKGARSAKA